MQTVRALAAIISGLTGLILLLPLVILLSPLWAVSVLTRGFQRLLQARVASWKELIEYEPIIGWKARPNLDTRAVAGDAFHLTTDADGWRGHETLSEANVVVFGDSFAFGFGVDDQKMYSRQVPGVRVKAIGINGYNLVQSLLWMERYAPRLEGKLIVWLVYYGNDLYENLCPNLEQYRMPFVRSTREGKWEIATEHVRAKKWIHTRKRDYLGRLSEICSGGFLTERSFSACDYLIGRARAVCREAGTNLVIVSAPELTQVSPPSIEQLKRMSTSPETFDPDLPDRRLEEICNAQRIRFVPLKRHLKASDFNLRDVHWTPSGHQRFAEVIGELYREHVASGGSRKPTTGRKLRLAVQIAGSEPLPPAETSAGRKD